MMIDELNFISSVTHVEKSHTRLNLSPPFNKRRSPLSSCEMIRVCMGIFTTAFRNKKIQPIPVDYLVISSET